MSLTIRKRTRKSRSPAPSLPPRRRNKRGSVFGSLFGKKNATSPTTEKTEAETVTPAADTEALPVSETAPKLEEPIDTGKPIDTAAVVAPVTHASEPTTSDVARDTTTTTETPAQAEKKPNFFSGLIKKVEGKKEEHKEEKAVETETSPAVAETTDGTADAKPERPGREKRRTSLFGNLGTLKKKTETSHETKPEEVNGTKPEEVNGTTESKREKSPLPSKISGLFRKPSKAVKSESTPKETTTEPTVDATPNNTAPAIDEPKPITSETTPQSNIIGDVVPEAVHAPVAPEVKASA